MNAAKLIDAYKKDEIKIVGSNIYPNPKESGSSKQLNFFESGKKESKIKPLQRFILDNSEK